MDSLREKKNQRISINLTKQIFNYQCCSSKSPTLWSIALPKKVIVLNKFISSGHISSVVSIKQNLINPLSVSSFPYLANKQAILNLLRLQPHFHFLYFWRNYADFLKIVSNLLFCISWKYWVLGLVMLTESAFFMCHKILIF